MKSTESLPEQLRRHHKKSMRLHRITIGLLLFFGSLSLSAHFFNGSGINRNNKNINRNGSQLHEVDSELSEAREAMHRLQKTIHHEPTEPQRNR